MNVVKRAGLLAVLMSLFSLGASAQTTIDTAGVVAQLNEISTALAAVGVVIIGLAALAVGYKWIKGMVFG